MKESEMQILDSLLPYGVEDKIANVEFNDDFILFDIEKLEEERILFHGTSHEKEIQKEGFKIKDKSHIGRYSKEGGLYFSEDLVKASSYGKTIFAVTSTAKFFTTPETNEHYLKKQYSKEDVQKEGCTGLHICSFIQSDVQSSEYVIFDENEINVICKFNLKERL